MITTDDVALAREHGCTIRDQVSTEARPGVFVTRYRHCGKPAAWLGEWRDTDVNTGRTEDMVSAACEHHHDLIAHGTLPMLDSRHQRVEVTWTQLEEAAVDG